MRKAGESHFQFWAVSVATLATLNGEVKIKSAANKLKPSTTTTSKINAEIYNGDTIITGLNSNAKIIFLDDSVIDVAPESVFKVENYEGTSAENRKATFNLLFGKFRALVTKAVGNESKLEVKTKESVMGVRGTELVVNRQSGSNSTQLTVITGSVDMVSAGSKVSAPPIAVSAGQQLTATGGFSGANGGASGQAGSVPVSLSTAQLGSITSSSRVSDNTFEKTVSVDSDKKNDSAPASATATTTASAAASQTVQEVASIDTSQTAVVTKGTFDTLKMSRDVPIRIIPANFQTVTVKLTR